MQSDDIELQQSEERDNPKEKCNSIEQKYMKEDS